VHRDGKGSNPLQINQSIHHVDWQIVTDVFEDPPAFGNINKQKANFICKREQLALCPATEILDNDDRRTNGVLLYSTDCFLFSPVM
jgi:hypothetical protein